MSNRNRKSKNPGTYFPPTGETDPAVIVGKTGHVHVFSGVPAPCELCGALEELRPYGPKGENICFDCAMKDEKTTARMFGKKFK